jgi:TM2 domain-containing membrane protein YozV
MFNALKLTALMGSIFFLNLIEAGDSISIQPQTEQETKRINPLPFLASSMIIPGSGQFLLGHKVEGPFIFLFELVLWGSGVNDGFYLTSKWQENVDRIKKILDQPFTDKERMFLGNKVSSDSMAFIDSLELYEGELKYSQAIRNRTVVWASGFHLFNILDCYQYFYLKNRKKSLSRNPKGALLRSLTIPGWGQFYNREYSKLGLLMMAVFGITSNIHGWNNTAGFFEDLESRYKNLYNGAQPVINNAKLDIEAYNKKLAEIDTALSESNLPIHTVDSLHDEENSILQEKHLAEQKRDELTSDSRLFSAKQDRYNREKKSYLSKRNQNVWYLFAIYLYAAFDAFVDAHLSDIDKRLDFSLIPQFEGLGLVCRFSF